DTLPDPIATFEDLAAGQYRLIARILHRGRQLAERTVLVDARTDLATTIALERQCELSETGGSDGIDNDCDGPADCADDGCAAASCRTACSEGGTCSTDGLCEGGTPIVCDDDNVCTNDRCDPDAGCVYDNNQEPCDDESACTTGDVCSGGVCSGLTLDC